MALDAYRTLGLEPGASTAEVKRAYRQLAKAFHPDSAGPAALPRFLAIHEAYEELTNGGGSARGVAARSAGARGGGAGAAGAGAARGAAGGPEPWRADPAKARAAREQARARGRAGTGASGGTSGGATSGGASGRAAGAGSGGPRAGTGSSRATGSTGGGGARRRSSRKATLGSTSYDEARDPADTSWGGASWYGPTSGEYWRVNPREYADPRKHGPEYQSRARRQSTTTGEAWEPASDDAGPEQTGPATAESAARSGPRSDPAASFAARPAAGAGPAAGARPADKDRVASRAWAARPRPDRDFRNASAGDDASERLSTIARMLEREPRDPIRRLGYALLAWAPIGLAAAAVIGGTTGCAVYRADCTGLAPLLPWLAQAIVLGLLLLLPTLARILSIGTLAVVLALVPGALFILAFGGSGQPEAAAALQAILAVVWAAGVAVGIAGATRSRQRVAAPP